MKKLLKSSLSIFLAIAIIFSSAYVGLNELDFSGIFAVKAEAASESVFTFELNEDGISYSVTECDKSATDEIVIPDIYNGFPVTNIGRYAFRDCAEITSITIADSVISICDYAFSGCTNLTSITIPNSVTSIGNSAFPDIRILGNKGSTAETYANENSYGFVPLDGDESETTASGTYGKVGWHIDKIKGVLTVSCEVDMPLFSDNEKLPWKEYSVFVESLVVENATSISGYTFSGMYNLRSVILPKTIKSIGYAAFFECEKLSSVHITDIMAWCGINCSYYYSNPLWRAHNLYLNGELVTDLVIPDGVTSIGDYAFNGCSLASVTIPNSVTSIGRGAFNGCSFASVTIPDSVTSIGGSAFGFCTNLKSIKLPNDLTRIDGETFSGCTSLLTISFPQNLTSIEGSYAFSDCTSLKSIVIPNSVTNIGYGAFRDCSDLESVTIPNSVTNIGRIAFSGCTSMKKITVHNDSLNINNTDLPSPVEIHANEGSLAHQYAIDTGKTFVEIVHSFCEVIVKKPTCTEIGYNEHTCSVCGRFERFDEVHATGHSYNNWVTVSEPSCIMNGLKEKTCSLCGDVVTETITALGHDYSNEWTIDMNPSCTEDGSKSHHCSRCDNKADITSIEVTGHSYGNWIVDMLPTCTEKGSLHKTCTVCGDVVTETIAALGHNYSTEWTIDKEPTCSEEGSKSHHCLYCNKKTDITIIIATGHKYSDWIIDTKATVFKAGFKHKECTVCGEVLETAKISQLKCSKLILKSIENTQYGVLTKWGEVSGADKYRVYRKTSKGDWTYIATTSNTYYTDKTAKSGTKYYYAVKARNEAGNSSLSSSLSRYYLADPTLNAPSSSSKGIGLRWSKVEGAEGYMVYRKTADGSYKRITTEKGVSNVTFRDTTAKKGTKYYYKVKAYYSKTYSAYSNTKAITDKY